MAKRLISITTEGQEHFEEEELDRIMSFLVYTLMNETWLDQEDIYAYVYGDGKKIVWN